MGEPVQIASKPVRPSGTTEVSPPGSGQSGENPGFVNRPPTAHERDLHRFLDRLRTGLLVTVNDLSAMAVEIDAFPRTR